MRYSEITTQWKLIPIDALPSATIDDICANIVESSAYFANDQDPLYLRRNLVGLVNEPKVWFTEYPVANLMPIKHAHSERVVTDYATMLSNKQFEFDPVLTSHGRWLDGGHRLKAYARAGRALIPVVDIGHLLDAPREVWEDWFDGVEDAHFDPGVSP